MGHLPAMDFETYSEAGYKFDPSCGYFVPLMKGKPGIQAINAPVYAEHPSTRIISLAYDLLDGCGVRLWLPWNEPPVPLFNYRDSGGLIEAHNSAFEYYIWTYVCYLRMGWPYIPLNQYRCSAAKARAWGLPGSLENLSTALNPTEKKSSRGKELIRLLSVPKKPTAKDPDLFRSFVKYPELHYEMYSYNDQDVRAERSISGMMPDMLDFETQVWLLDQRINTTGVSIDIPGLQACIQMFRQAEAKYTKELREITGGEIQTVDEISKGSAGDKWLIARKFDVDSLDKATVDLAVENGQYLHPDVLRVLQIRQIIGGSSVKKLFAMERYLNKDGKIRDLFQYCGAERTGRFAGRGPQPQNLKNSGPELDGREWGNTLAEQALEDIHAGDLEAVEAKWGNAVDLIGSCMRSLFIAAPGYDFICSDYSAIEAVVLAAMAGEEWRLEVFRTHGKIYEASIAKTTGTPLEEILDHKRKTGKHHPLRKKGKVRELACLGGNTLVLTDSGWKCMTDVKTDDLVFDGVEFVQHGGVISMGNRLTTKMGGVTVTKDHKFFIGEDKWATTEDLNENTYLLSAALNTARLLLLKNTANRQEVYSDTIASVNAEASIYMNRQISGSESPLGAIDALKRKQQKPLQNILASVQIKKLGVACLGEFQQLSGGASILPIVNSHLMVEEESTSMLNGSQTGLHGLNTFVLCPAMITQGLQSIESTITSDTNLETYDSSVIENNKTTNEEPFGWNIAERKCRLPNFTPTTARNIDAHIPSRERYGRAIHFKKLLNSSQDVEDRIENVFDILNCGHRSRYVILSEYGPIIAHNCGYGGWIGAQKNFGADKFMTDAEIKQDVIQWRADSPMIVEMWGGQYRKYEKNYNPHGVEGMAICAVMDRGLGYKYRDVGFYFDPDHDVLYITLPSGRSLSYHSPRLTLDNDNLGRDIYRLSFMGMDGYTHKWSRISTYGPKLVENIVQAASRDILVSAMLRLDAAGYRPVLHVHDEIVTEVPEGLGSVEEMEGLMVVREPWFSEWPIRASGGWRGKRYRK